MDAESVRLWFSQNDKQRQNYLDVNKLNHVKSVLNEPNARVMIYTQHRQIFNQLTRQLKNIAVYDGQQNERNKATAKHQYNSGAVNGILISPDVITGLSLWYTGKVIFWEPVVNSSMFDQIVARAVRRNSHSQNTTAINKDQQNSLRKIGTPPKKVEVEVLVGYLISLRAETVESVLRFVSGQLFIGNGGTFLARLSRRGNVVKAIRERENNEERKKGGTGNSTNFKRIVLHTPDINAYQAYLVSQAQNEQMKAALVGAGRRNRPKQTIKFRD